MSVKWVTDRAVVAGHYCSFQGGLKQAGNVGMALWYAMHVHPPGVLPLYTDMRRAYRSFMLSIHVFNVLFMRLSPSTLGRYLLISGGWFAVLFVVVIGPLAIQTDSKGPYFGPSGYWYAP